MQPLDTRFREKKFIESFLKLSPASKIALNIFQEKIKKHKFLDADDIVKMYKVSSENKIDKKELKRWIDEIKEALSKLEKDKNDIAYCESIGKALYKLEQLLVEKRHVTALLILNFINEYLNLPCMVFTEEDVSLPLPSENLAKLFLSQKIQEAVIHQGELYVLAAKPSENTFVYSSESSPEKLRVEWHHLREAQKNWKS